MTMQMNVPEPQALLDQEGEKKVTELKEKKIANACTYVILKEDHTVGNVIQSQLLKNKHVKYAGYKAPHPLENKIEIKIQTDDPGYAPRKALKESMHDIRTSLDIFKKEFEEQVSNIRKKDEEDAEDDQMEDEEYGRSEWDQDILE